jgi:AraC-like DNA-binding protein
VNEYRLKAVIGRLKSTEFDHLTIIAIANDCGFNSKSTFNSLFKQYTGHTPSEFKRHQREAALSAE